MIVFKTLYRTNDKNETKFAHMLYKVLKKDFAVLTENNHNEYKINES